jgi:hypothetical protein
VDDHLEVRAGEIEPGEHLLPHFGVGAERLAAAKVSAIG